MEGVHPPERITVAWLVDAADAIFRAAGLAGPAARTVAESLVDADRRGIPSHGVMLVPMYVERLRRGSVSTADTAEVVSDHGAVAVLDARHQLGQLSGDQAMRMAVTKAKSFGMGVVVVRHAFHFGGAFRYVEAAARQGCIGVAAANTRPLMPAPGGARAVVGNNPIAFGIPRHGEPLILDMALSEAALGKIRIAAAEGRPIPSTWATDAAGSPTADPVAALAGMLLPAAGHKGYGLALIVDVLTGVLSGGAFGAAVQGLYADTGTVNDCAHFFLALDTAAFGDPGDFADRVEQLARSVTESPAAPGVDRVLLPGQLEQERYAVSATDGVVVDRSVLRALQETADSLQVVLPPTDQPQPAGAAS
ncbi:Ldh family oxidoreductase [Planosporangium sp. 12N6]|uniref:Ldh family oxidoreductase n=1 Tax=Planosporangium spinosum TaxID=3402278 RepID=UPI003CF8F814